tara:strand:+ start:959 stop:1273 length:315 start_codon:yes stop_codon:yes gene_type:complete
MKFVVTTQYLENYGAHGEDGKFSTGNAYWKMKGGTDYIVSGLTRVQDAVAFVMAKFGVNDISQKEYPTAFRTYDEWQDELAQESDDYAEFIRSWAKEVNPCVGA